MKTQRFIPLFLVLAGLLAYHNMFQNAFIFDDGPHIVRYERIRQLWPPWGILTHSSRPLVHLSLAINYALGGLNPWGYHLFNLLIHILAALALYGIVRRTLLTPALRSKWAGPAPWLAALVAAIWLVHPLQTESVTYTIQRGESLMGLFYLLTLYCVIRCDGSPRAVWWKAGALASCFLGAASKEVIVTAPLIVALYDRVFLAGSWRAVLQRRWGLYAGLAASWLLLAVLVMNPAPDVPDFTKPSAGFSYKEITPVEYALTQPGVVLHYLRLALWPDALCFDRGCGFGWPVANAVSDVWLELVIFGGLLAATAWALVRKPAWGFLGAWFFLILAPTSSIMPIADVVVEHRVYLSLAAVAALGVLVGYRIVDQTVGLQKTFGRVLVWSLGGAVVGALVWLTIQRNSDYTSELTIWRDTVEKCPINPRAHYNLGLALEHANDLQGSIEQYEEAVRIKPDFAEARYNFGVMLERVNRFPEAIQQYQQAVQINTNYVDALNNLGHVLSITGRPADAIGYLERAVKIKPGLAEGQYNLGYAFVQVGKVDDAIAHWELALKIKPDYAEAHNNLGIVLAQQGKIQEAIGHWQQAVRIKPDLAEAHNNLAYALSQVGRIEEAKAQYEEALRVKPDYAEARAGLDHLLSPSPQGRATGGP